MFHGLFGDEDSQYKSSESSGSVSKSSSVPRPPEPRGRSKLCGLSNLGATCYLNSLLQTLHFTPEFREALFSLTDSQLGISSDGNTSDNSMVRVIPLELQRLFAQLLLLDKCSAGVTALTDSFGWTNNEELQQHDVQELNRILFSAIESSLVGTPGEKLISKLYHGATVQQITCKFCGRVSEREEEFLDLPVALSGHAGLEQTLAEAYIKTEALEGANQYFCEVCQKLVDATRGCHIRKLPSILTFALLRFLYDFKKGDRYKDTNRFKFPMVLDMAPYCEAGAVKGSTIYELFSVVIHSGSTHSGHYTAFIRDVDDLGQWTRPEDEPIKAKDPDTGKVDLIDCENPADLLATLLSQLGGTASTNKLLKCLSDQTGVTWNKRFKKQFGSFVKYIKSCSSMFSISDTNNICLIPPGTQMTSDPPDLPDTASNSSSASLREGPLALLGMGSEVASSSCLGVNDVKMASPEKPSVEGGEGGEEGVVVDIGSEVRPQADVLPPSGHRWFEFNDAEVSPISAKLIEKMFAGKKSAYMLFYRKQSLERPPEGEELLKFC